MSNVSPLMYSIDNQDAVVERSDLPQLSIGAPCPVVLSGEHFLHLAYYLEDRQEGWDGSTVRVVGEHSEGELCALVRFTHAAAHLFGPPNDEAFAGHPLADRGLEPYAAFEVNNSSWVRTLERMNSVHPYHRPERFAKYKHFVFAFHDSVFECVAESFELSVHRGSVSAVLRASWPQG
jgi:hypothetical protein